MPAQLKQSHSLGMKIVSVRPQNKKYPTVCGLVMLVDEETGMPNALIDAAQLTAIRTAAGSGVATKYLAKKDAKVLLVFGAGNQGKNHIEAMCIVRPSIEEILVWNRTKERAELLVKELKSFSTRKVEIVLDIDQALAKADIICTCTNSTTPLFDGKKIKSGCHINCIGSYTPDMQEVDIETIKRSKIVCDIKEAVLEESGDLIIPITKGVITEKHVIASLGEVCAKKGGVRINNDEITLFKSVGNALQDISVAQIVLKNAEKSDLGTKINF